jgi:hypothetical protein
MAAQDLHASAGLAAVVGGGISEQVIRGSSLVSLSNTAIITATANSTAGLVVAYGTAWLDVARALGNDWSLVYKIESRQWEEIYAGALNRQGFTVTLTPDPGREVAARATAVVGLHRRVEQPRPIHALQS